MTVQELYYQFHLLLNKNHQAQNIKVDEGNFVILFNRESKRWLSDFIEKNNNTDNIYIINELKVKNFELEFESEDSNYIVYKIPTNYYSVIYGDSYSVVKKENCQSIIYNYIVKPQDQSTILKSSFYKPSWRWERGLMDISQNKLIVYKGDFDIVNTYISYFTEIPTIDIGGYKTVIGNLSVDKHPTFSDWICEEILDRVVTEVMRQFENPQGFQLSKDREINSVFN